MNGKPVKVVYILAWGRSGSTVLGNLLGELDGFFHAGELRTLWGRGLQHGRLCGCGVPVAECEVWSRVLHASLDGGRVDGREVLEWQRSAMRVRLMRKILRLRPDHPSAWEPLERFRDVQTRVYRSIAESTGARVIVDSSKRQPEAALLPLLEGVDPYLVQLVRDPRAVAYSWRRRKTSPNEGKLEEMIQYAPRTSARNWMIMNIGAQAIRRRFPDGRSMLIRYEDFVARPLATIDAILELIGERPAPLETPDGQSFLIGMNHTAGGNPDRLAAGRIVLRRDDEWLARQRRWDRLVSTTLTLPLLRRYGYRVRPGHNGRDAEDRVAEGAPRDR